MSNEKWKPSAADRAVIEALIAEQAKEESAVAFAKHFLPFGPEKWSKIKNAIDPTAGRSYFDEVKDPESVIAELADALENIPQLRANLDRINAQGVLELSKFKAVLASINQCRNKTNPERLTKYIAPTGGGKTMLVNYLLRKAGVKAFIRSVEAREAWKRSYFVFLCDVAAALGIRIKGESMPSKIEDAIIRFCLDKTIILVIDEGEFFGASALNGIKLFLNKTRMIILINSIREAHDKWNRYFPMEAAQISRRTNAIVELTSVDVKDAALFFSANQFKDAEKALGYIAKQATEFGHYSLIARTAEKLRGVERCGYEDVAKAVTSARLQMDQVEGGVR